MRNISDMNSDMCPAVLSVLWQQPWLSTFQIAAYANIEEGVARQQLQQAVTEGQVQSLSQSQSHLPAALFSLTEAGMTTVTPKQNWPRYALHLQFIRQHLSIHQHINALGTVLARAIPDWRITCSTVISRTFKKSPLILHGQLRLYMQGTVQPFYVLIDDGIGAPMRWTQQLRYYKRWSTQSQDQFPPLLILCPSRFRAGVLLHLAHEIGLRSPVFATWQRDIAFSNGLHQCEWLTWTNGSAANALPFGPTYPVVNLNTHCDIGLNPKLERRSNFGFNPISRVIANSLNPLENILAALNDTETQVLGFLVQHPVCSLNTALAFTALNEEMAIAVIEKLVALQLVAPVPLPAAQHPDSVWRATDSAVKYWARLHGHDPRRAVEQYAMLCRDRQRRPHHALAVFGFFEHLQRDIAQRNRALRPLDAQGTAHLALTLFEDELHARSSLRWQGVQHHWWPDGFGCLRSGHVSTYFWLEMDGSLHTPARSDAAAWRVKFDSLSAYIATGRWRFRSPTLPQLLIITHQPTRCKHLIQDGLSQAAHIHGIEPPKVYIASHTELRQRGPLSHCWLDAQQSLMPYPQWLTPFPNLQPHLVHSPLSRFDLISELRRAERTGALAYTDKEHNYDLPHFPTLR